MIVQNSFIPIEPLTADILNISLIYCKDTVVKISRLYLIHSLRKLYQKLNKVKYESS
jgi:hypothetical protein